MRDREKSSGQCEPLDIATWCRSAEQLQKDLQPLDLMIECDRLLRRAFVLSKLLPAPLASEFSAPVSEVEFENLLLREDLDRAAIAFLNANLALETEKPDGLLGVRVTSLRFGMETGHEAPDLPRAVVGAWLNCVFAVIANIVAQQAAINTDQRRLRRAPHLRPTVH